MIKNKDNHKVHLWNSKKSEPIIFLPFLSFLMMRINKKESNTYFS